VGNIYPDGSAGSCVACQIRHRFSIEEAPPPRSGAPCHVGPHHPDIQGLEKSKHDPETESLRLQRKKGTAARLPGDERGKWTAIG